MTDQRVTHMWDLERQAGCWYAEHSPPRGFLGGPVVWDAYYLYGVESQEVVLRGRGSGERETTASSLAGKQQAREKEDNGGQGKDGPAGAIAQGGNGR